MEPKNLVGRYLHILCEDSRWYWAVVVAHSARASMVHAWFEDGTRTWYALESVREDGGGGALRTADAAGCVKFDFVSAEEWSARLDGELLAEQEFGEGGGRGRANDQPYLLDYCPLVSGPANTRGEGQ